MVPSESDAMGVNDEYALKAPGRATSSTAWVSVPGVAVFANGIASSTVRPEGCEPSGLDSAADSVISCKAIAVDSKGKGVSCSVGEADDEITAEGKGDGEMEAGRGSGWRSDCDRAICGFACGDKGKDRNTFRAGERRGVL